MNVAVFVIFLGFGIFCFLLIQPILSYPISFPIFSLLQNDIQLFSNTIRQQDTIQEISAENGIKNGNNIDVTTSREAVSRDITVGLWTPTNTSFALQHLKGEEQEKAMDTLLKKGYGEYYYVMNNFEDPKSLKMTDNLLETANKTNLKIIIILLPPSEGGPDTSYNWKGWIKYFNSLEKKYPRSFEGFTIDDFNWISTRTDTKFRNNVDFMEYSDLSELLKHKSKDVKFYPTVYFEGRKTGIVVKKYDNFIDGLIVASGCYYNVSTLERQLHIFSEIFKKPIRYIVYPTITYNYSKLDYSPPSDRLIMATLSIASNSSDGLIIWRDLDNPVIQEHMNNRHDKQYLSDISNSKEKQISDENIDSNIKLSETKNVHNTCNGWSKKYNEAYDMWIKLPAEKDHDNWKKKIS
ncbi:MAG: hypothetical protein E6L04_10580 [Thaumarchaeota archaeon]|nr:MAG: hypothetical protein E6L04_10580 [Nitrososphaerota archaeon]TLX87331.1 MAG: hypothetical protein E6K97_08840 [Nitrososphaerota archaeon]